MLLAPPNPPEVPAAMPLPVPLKTPTLLENYLSFGLRLKLPGEGRQGRTEWGFLPGSEWAGYRQKEMVLGGKCPDHHGPRAKSPLQGHNTHTHWFPPPVIEV